MPRVRYVRWLYDCFDVGSRSPVLQAVKGSAAALTPDKSHFSRTKGHTHAMPLSFSLCMAWWAGSVVLDAGELLAVMHLGDTEAFEFDQSQLPLIACEQAALTKGHRTTLFNWHCMRESIPCHTNKVLLLQQQQSKDAQPRQGGYCVLYNTVRDFPGPF